MTSVYRRREGGVHAYCQRLNLLPTLIAHFKLTSQRFPCPYPAISLLISQRIPKLRNLSSTLVRPPHQLNSYFFNLVHTLNELV
jgi:hypothetical protein